MILAVQQTEDGHFIVSDHGGTWPTKLDEEGMLDVVAEWLDKRLAGS